MLVSLGMHGTIGIESAEVFDVIILDLPDPSNFAVSKLYSREFYASLVQRLAGHGAIVTQAGSPLFAREAFWSIAETFSVTGNPLVPGEGLEILPYHAHVPSFGNWGFVIAHAGPLRTKSAPFPPDLKFINASHWDAMKRFPNDTAAVPVDANSVITHALVTYYRDGWERWFGQ